MRKLMWFVIGFSAACGLFAYGLSGEWMKIVIPASGILSLVFALLAGKWTVYRRPALVFLGVTAGLFWYTGFHSRYLEPARAMHGKTETVTVRVSDYGRKTDYGVSAEARLELEGKTYPVRLYLKEKESPKPGMLLTGVFRFSVTAPEEDPASYLSGEGIFLTARQEEDLIVRMDPESLWLDKVAHLRRWLTEALEATFPKDVFPFAQALLLGDTSAIDYETDTEFKISGIRHVIAVSGLHVSILVALLSAVTFHRRFVTVPVGLAVLVLFAALAGFSPSVSRACIMAGLMLLAMLFGREYDGPTALAFAAGVMLLCNPLVITSVSFQLSVASVAGIYLFTDRLRRWLLSLLGKNRMLRWTTWISASVSVTLGAMALTTPLCAYYFGMVSLVGVVTNLLTLWVVSGIFYGCMAVCVLYALWGSAAAVLGWIVAWPIRYVLFIAGIMADVPLAAVYMNSPYLVAWLVFVYILLAVFLLDERRSPKQLICCGTLALAIALLASWNKPEEDGTVLTVLDVGHGQCVLLETEGTVWMVDCGGDYDEMCADTAASYLLSRGIECLDGLILTHMDADHAGGAELLLSRVDTKLLVLPEEHTDIAGENTLWASENLRIGVGEASIHIYVPTYPGTGNEKSLCVLFDTEKCDILITGDRDGFGERMLLRRNAIPDVDILVAGHHGSAHSTSEELLSAVRPEIVCISAGADNPFGNPAPELLDRLADFGCTVYRTDLHGTITIRR